MRTNASWAADAQTVAGCHLPWLLRQIHAKKREFHASSAADRAGVADFLYNFSISFLAFFLPTVLVPSIVLTHR